MGNLEDISQCQFEKKRILGPDDISISLLKELITCGRLSELVSSKEFLDNQKKTKELLANMPDELIWDEIEIPVKSKAIDIKESYRDALFRCGNKMILVSSYGSIRSKTQSSYIWDQVQGDIIPQSFDDMARKAKWAKRYAQQQNCRLLLTGTSNGAGPSTYAGLLYGIPVRAIAPLDLGKAARKKIKEENERNYRNANNLIINVRIKDDPLSPWTKVTEEDIKNRDQFEKIKDNRKKEIMAYTNAFYWRLGRNGKGISIYPLGIEIEIPSCHPNAQGWAKHLSALPSIERLLEIRTTSHLRSRTLANTRNPDINHSRRDIP